MKQAIENEAGAASGAAGSAAPAATPDADAPKAASTDTKKKASKKKASKKKASKKKASKKKASRKKASRKAGYSDDLAQVLAAVDQLRDALHDLAVNQIDQRKQLAEEFQAAARSGFSEVESAARKTLNRLTGKG
ncbi:MAG: hypothetical protein R6V61_02700 [Wenzhouxiangellaceae bacterium]